MFAWDTTVTLDPSPVNLLSFSPVVFLRRSDLAVLPFAARSPSKGCHELKWLGTGALCWRWFLGKVGVEFFEALRFSVLWYSKCFDGVYRKFTAFFVRFAFFFVFAMLYTLFEKAFDCFCFGMLSILEV